MSSCFTFPVYILMENNILLTVGGRNFAPLYGEYLTMSFSFPCVCPPLSPPALILICPCPQVPGIDLRLPMSLGPLIAILNLGVARGACASTEKVDCSEVVQSFFHQQSREYYFSLICKRVIVWGDLACRMLITLGRGVNYDTQS